MRMITFILVAVWVFSSSTSYAQERYAAFVADMDSGEVLHARRADAERYPASLTKLMTLYLTFEALEAERIALDTPLRTSNEAASRPASHLGLRPGETIRVQDAIRALIVQSANDVAVVIAEHLADTEAQFAVAMTEKARALGMANTRFKNASGLPDARQVTTARDIARLAHALRRDFADYWGYFSEEEFRWNGRTHHTHNALVGSLDGVDGLKTGYIRASGFNIATTAQRGEARLIAVVMGGASAAVRDAHTRDLIDAGFAALSSRNVGTHLAAMELPRLNPVREQALLTNELRGQIRPIAMGSAPASPPVQIEMDEPRLSLRPEWAIQVGAFASTAAASARLESITAMISSELLQTSQTAIEPLSRSGRQLWRARITGLDAERARLACEELRRFEEACFAVGPEA